MVPLLRVLQFPSIADTGGTHTPLCWITKLMSNMRAKGVNKETSGWRGSGRLSISWYIPALAKNPPLETMQISSGTGEHWPTPYSGHGATNDFHVFKESNNCSWPTYRLSKLSMQPLWIMADKRPTKLHWQSLIPLGPLGPGQRQTNIHYISINHDYIYRLYLANKVTWRTITVHIDFKWSFHDSMSASNSMTNPVILLPQTPSVKTWGAPATLSAPHSPPRWVAWAAAMRVAATELATEAPGVSCVRCWGAWWRLQVVGEFLRS